MSQESRSILAIRNTDGGSGYSASQASELGCDPRVKLMNFLEFGSVATYIVQSEPVDENIARCYDAKEASLEWNVGKCFQ